MFDVLKQSRHLVQNSLLRESSVYVSVKYKNDLIELKRGLNHLMLSVSMTRIKKPLSPFLKGKYACHRVHVTMERQN